eukprot:767221-Hanusia_phi.AAC.2
MSACLSDMMEFVILNISNFKRSSFIRLSQDPWRLLFLAHSIISHSFFLNSTSCSFITLQKSQFSKLRNERLLEVKTITTAYPWLKSHDLHNQQTFMSCPSLRCCSMSSLSPRRQPAISAVSFAPCSS